MKALTTTTMIKGYATLAVSEVVAYEVASKEKFVRFEVAVSKAGIITAGPKSMYWKTDKLTDAEKVEAKATGEGGVFAHGFAENLSVDLSQGFGLVDWLVQQFAWVEKNQQALEKLAQKVLAVEPASPASKSGPVTVTKIGAQPKEEPKAKAPKAKPPVSDDIEIESLIAKYAQNKRAGRTTKI